MAAESEDVQYEVEAEVSALAWEAATPHFARYRVPLSGEVDQPWLSCFEQASLDSPEFSRFRIDPDTRTVSFTSKMSDGPAEVAAVLRRLRLLIDFVNTRAHHTPERVAEPLIRRDAFSQ